MKEQQKPILKALKKLSFITFLCAATTSANALLIPFDKERIKAAGKNCLSGFDGNLGEVAIFYAGSTSDLNKYLRSFSNENRPLGGKQLPLLVILHSGSSVLPEYLESNSKTAVDWRAYNSRTLQGEGGSNPENGFHLQVDIWLGENIKLSELQIPQDFEVRSSKEIQDFVDQHEERRKQAKTNSQKKDPKSVTFSKSHQPLLQKKICAARD